MTLPIFVLYHLGVVFLPVRNAADWVTRQLVDLVHQDKIVYSVLTLSLGGVYVAVLVLFGRGHTFRWKNFGWLAMEAVVYAFAMRVAASAIDRKLFLSTGINGAFSGIVMSLGAGLYEEVAFRAGLFGGGLRLVKILFNPATRFRRVVVSAIWAVAASVVFSAWHHFGSLGDPFEMRVFVFRSVCGLIFTGIYLFRGFAPTVWTHVVYDLWVLVL